MAFGKYTLEEVKQKQALKLTKAKENKAKAVKLPAKPKNAGKVAKQAKKRKKRTERQLAEDKLWELCKKITRKVHGDTCYTCSATGLEGSNWHTGHGKPKGALPLRYKYDLRNLRPQCMRDNIHYGGMSDIFIDKLEQEETGLQFLLESCEKTNGVWRIKQGDTMGGKDGTIFLQNLILEYKNLL